MNKIAGSIAGIFGACVLIVLVWGGYEYSWLKEARVTRPEQTAQIETKRLSEQVASLTREVDDLRNSVESERHSPGR